MLTHRVLTLSALCTSVAACSVSSTGPAGDVPATSSSGGESSTPVLTDPTGGSPSGGAADMATEDDAGRIGGRTDASETGSAGSLGPSEATRDAGSLEGDERPWFSFFTTSQAGLLHLRYGDDVPSDLSQAGFGGDLGGLAGADEKCAALARRGSPTDEKVWRAFLSATAGGPNGGPVNAIERIGDGPWFDFHGRTFAKGLGELSMSADGRPGGADAALAEMFTDENGDPISADTMRVDNHDVMTGTGEEGFLSGDYEATCRDWTYAGMPPDGIDARLQVGHAWPRSTNTGRHWIADHRVKGCMPGVNTGSTGGARSGDFRAGASGGYGAFYCFALLDD